MKVEHFIQDKSGVIKISGNVNLYELYMLRDSFEEFQEKSLEKVILDLSEVDYIDSSGIGLLIAQATKYKDKQIKFVLASINKSIEHVFKVTSFAKLFLKSPSLTEALND